MAGVTGWIDCLDDGLLPCTYVGYPVGVDMSIGMPIFGGAFILTRFGISPEAAVNVLALATLAAGVGALWALVTSITRNVWAGGLAAALYYSAPMIAAHAGLISLFFGFIWLPVPVATVYAALRAAQRRSTVAALLWLGLTAIAALMIVYLDPYAWTIALALIGPLCLVGGFLAFRSRAWPVVGVAIAALLAAALPGALFRAVEPSADLSADYPLDFYRAMGVDLGTAVVPTRDSILGDALNVPVEGWNKFEFYGDGSQLTGTYLGIVGLAAAIGGLVIAIRRPRTRGVAVALVIGGVACLALGMGPSLKLLDRADRPVGTSGTYTFADYLMPASEATAPTPWSWAYGIQPVEGMRAAYRWHVGLRFVWAILAAIAIVELFRRRRLLAVALGAFIVMESLSHTFFDARANARSAFDRLATFEEDMEREFEGGRLQPAERVLFLPAANDYLVQAIAPRLQVFTYNISFDKELTRIRPQQPPAVVAAINAYSNGTLNQDILCEVFRQDLAEAVVFPDFDLRWDSYSWPPSEERLAARRQANVELGLFDDPGFEVDTGPTTVVVRAAPDRGC
jgi:hypothetical protein